MTVGSVEFFIVNVILFHFVGWMWFDSIKKMYLSLFSFIGQSRVMRYHDPDSLSIAGFVGYFALLVAAEIWYLQ